MSLQYLHFCRRCMTFAPLGEERIVRCHDCNAKIQDWDHMIVDPDDAPGEIMPAGETEYWRLGDIEVWKQDKLRETMLSITEHPAPFEDFFQIRCPRGTTYLHNHFLRVDPRYNQDATRVDDTLQHLLRERLLSRG